MEAAADRWEPPYIYAKAGERKIISVPVHGSKTLKPGLASRLARDANISW